MCHIVYAKYTVLERWATDLEDGHKDQSVISRQNAAIECLLENVDLHDRYNYDQ